MVSRKNLIYVGVAFLLVVVIILAFLGGFQILTPFKPGPPPPPPPLPPLPFPPNNNFQNIGIKITDYEQTTGKISYTYENPTNQKISSAQTMTARIECSASGCGNMPPMFVNKSNEIVIQYNLPATSGQYSFTDMNLIIPPSDSLRTAAIFFYTHYGPDVDNIFPIQ